MFTFFFRTDTAQFSLYSAQKLVKFYESFTVYSNNRSSTVKNLQTTKMEFIKQEIYNLDGQTTIEFLDKSASFNKTTTVVIDKDRFFVCKQLCLENGKFSF